MLGSFDLGYRIIQHFRLASTVYVNTVQTLTRRKQHGRVAGLLKQIRVRNYFYFVSPFFRVL